MWLLRSRRTQLAWTAEKLNCWGRNPDGDSIFLSPTVNTPTNLKVIDLSTELIGWVYYLKTQEFLFLESVWGCPKKVLSSLSHILPTNQIPSSPLCPTSSPTNQILPPLSDPHPRPLMIFPPPLSVPNPHPLIRFIFSSLSHIITHLLIRFPPLSLFHILAH